jgi:hypothetical protein
MRVRYQVACSSKATITATTNPPSGMKAEKPLVPTMLAMMPKMPNGMISITQRRTTIIAWKPTSTPSRTLRSGWSRRPRSATPKAIAMKITPMTLP